MKVLVFAPVSLNEYHFETELEIAQCHLDAGDEVAWVACRALLPTCDWNRKHDIGPCLVCRSRAARGLERLAGEVTIRTIPCLTSEDQDAIAATAVPDTIEALRRLSVPAPSEERLRNPSAGASPSFGGFDLGLGVLSSLVSLLREPNPDLAVHRRLVRDLLVAAHGTFRSMVRLLDEERPDRAILYNGRFALQRAAMRACQCRGVPFATHERGRDYRHYSLYENHMPHDPDRLLANAQSAWATADPTERCSIAHRFFEERAAGKQQQWFSFTAAQAAEKLPAGFDRGLRNIAVFLSSQDEFVAISHDQFRHLYASQEQGVERIAASAAGDERVHFFVRVHPNLRGVDNSQTRGVALLRRLRNVTVIPADSDISTYALLHACDRVLSFGSTVGIEAVYWGKPSIVAGPALYQAFSGPIYPATHDDTMGALTMPITAGAIEDALVFAHYRATQGIPYRYFQPTSLRGGPYGGAPIQASPSSLRVTRLLSGLPASLIRIGGRGVWRGIAHHTHGRRWLM